MKIIGKKLKGLIEIEPTIFNDERGLFFESFNQNSFKDIGIDQNFLQDNQSFSKKGVIRGLHFQNDPNAQGKLVRTVKGKVLDVVVDIRRNSPTFGQWESVILDSNIGNMLWVPVGFAHGFAAIEDSIFLYKCTNIYNKESEAGILWSDETLNIDWCIYNPIVSSKDKNLPNFKEQIEKNKLF